jgi:trk system potassium uptake protein TrkH
MTIIAINNYGNAYETLGRSFRFAGFQAASILTTTGFTTTNYAQWPVFSQVVLFLLMFIGGCSGSTGGGMKVIIWICFPLYFSTPPHNSGCRYRWK